MKKGLISLIAGAAVLAGGLFGEYKHNDNKRIDEYLSSLRETTSAQYLYQKNPSEKNLGDYAEKLDRLRNMEMDYGGENLEKRLRSKGLLYFAKENGSKYLGKILKEGVMDDVKYYITTTSDKDFKGIKPLEHFLEGVDSVTVFKEKKDYSINIDISAMEKNGEEISRNWNYYLQNNSYLEKNDLRWNPTAQGIYSSLKGIPRDKIQGAYLSRAIENALLHENQHALDLRKGGYSFMDGEKRAFLKELMESPQIISALETLSRSENPGKMHEVYKPVSKDILGGLMRICKAKDKRDFYLKLSKGEIDIGGGAKILWQRWYPKD